MQSRLIVLLAVLACCILTVRGQAPTVTIMQTDPASHDKYLTANRDTDVVMDCYVENLPSDTTVRWQRTVLGSNGTYLILSLSQDMGLEDNIHYSIERPTQFTWRLRIRAIQTSDDGTYQCFVLTTLNSRASDIRIINVVVKPTLDLQQTSSDTTLNQGDDIDLTCNATGRPMPIIEWTRLGGALLPIGQEKLLGSVLAIRNIQPEDRGVYRCQALNSVGSDQTDINVNVRFAPIINLPRTLVHQAVGYRVELQCYAEANPNPSSADATWVFGSTTYSVSSEGYDVRYAEGAFGRVTFELIIFSVQESNFGDYTCRIKNTVGASTAKITLAMTTEPQASVKLGQVIKGDAATLKPVMSCAVLLAVTGVVMQIVRTV